MLLSDNIYEDAKAPPEGFLMEISTLDSLIATAQELAKPVFALDLDVDTEFRGTVADIYAQKIEDVRKGFEQGAEKIIKMTDAF